MTNRERASSDFEVKASKGNYTKLQDGDTKLRVLTSPIKGYVYFTSENKPKRSRKEPLNIPDIKEGGKVKEFWAVGVYNYNEQKVQVWEITQNSIRKQLRDLSKDEDFGNPTEYDIKISRTGKDLDTTYMLKAMSRKEFEDTLALEEAQSLRLEALFENDDPFKPL